MALKGLDCNRWGVNGLYTPYWTDISQKGFLRLGKPTIAEPKKLELDRLLRGGFNSKNNQIKMKS